MNTFKKNKFEMLTVPYFWIDIYHSQLNIKGLTEATVCYRYSLKGKKLKLPA